MKKTLFFLLSTLILFAGCSFDFLNGGDKGGGTFSPPNVTELNLNTWTDGNIPTSKDVQWFKFLAPQYLYSPIFIHINFGTLTNLNVQMYNYDGNTIDKKKNFSGDAKLNQWNDIYSYQACYIKVSPNSGGGTYQIAVNTSDTAPIVILPITLPSDAIALTAKNVWTDGNIPTETDKQWFKFTATSTQNPMTYLQYIHINFNTLTNLDIQIYDNRGYMVENKNLSGDKETVGYIYCHLTDGQEYYIKVSPYSGGGTYQIAVNLTYTAHTVYLILPSDVPKLTADIWTDCNIPTETDEQWFRFTAVAETHYIHFKAGTLGGIYVQLFNTDGSRNGTRNALTESHATFNNLTIGQEYYVRLLPYKYLMARTKYC